MVVLGGREKVSIRGLVREGLYEKVGVRELM